MNTDFNDKAALGAMIAAGVAVLVVMLAIQLFICWLVSNAVKRVPPEHRRMDPAHVWLLLIPCFGLVWNFFVYQRVPDSFSSYFASVGRTDVGDCGKQLGLWYAISSVATAVPILNWVAGPAALVLLILVLVKFNELKGKIGATV